MCGGVPPFPCVVPLLPLQVGGVPELTTSCTRLADVLTTLGHRTHDTTLVFVGQRFERCLLKSVLHARALGYDCVVVKEATYAKEAEADPEWAVGPAAALARHAAARKDDTTTGTPSSSGAAGAAPAWAADVYQARKSAGARLADGYMRAAGVRVVPTWPE